MKVEEEEGSKSKKSKGGKKEKKKSKKESKSDKSAGGENDEEGGFRTPSRNFQVKAEANKERKHDPGLVTNSFHSVVLFVKKH